MAIRSPQSAISVALLAGIMGAGLVLRLFLLSASLPTGQYPLVLDEGNYVGLATALSQGQGYVDKWPWVRPPAYPLFLTISLLLSDGGLVLATWVQILISVANIGLVYALAVDVFTLREEVPRSRAEAAGLAAAALMAFNPHAVLYSDHLMPEAMYICGLTAVAWALVRTLHIWKSHVPRTLPRRGLRLLALGGLFAGITILLRSILLSFTPLLLFWFWWVLPRGERREKKGSFAWLSNRWSWRLLVPLALYLAALFAVILPWTVRNYLAYDRFLLVDTLGGYNLWEYNDNIGIDQLDAILMKIPNPVDREQYATQQGIKAILRNAGPLAGEWAGRFADAWSLDSFSELRLAIRNKYPGIDCTYQDVYAWLETGFYVGLGLLTIWGLALAPGRTFKGLVFLFALHYAAVTVVAHSEFRYHMPLYPFASVYAGWALTGLIERVRNRRKGSWRGLAPASMEAAPVDGPQRPVSLWAPVIAGAITLLFLVQSALQAVPGMIKSISYEKRYLAAKSEFHSGNYQAALADFIGATELDKGCACLYRYIGLTQGQLGQADEERASYETALQREEFDWRTTALLSDRLRAAGNPRARNLILYTRPEYRAAQERWAWDSLSPPPVTMLDVGGDDIGYITDFQAIESDRNTTYRWTTDHSYARLAIPAGSGKLSVIIRLHSLGWPGPDDTVRIVVNGREAGEITAHPTWQEARLTLPDSVVSGSVGDRLVIELLTPARKPPGPETRHLGVAVDYIALERQQ